VVASFCPRAYASNPQRALGTCPRPCAYDRQKTSTTTTDVLLGGPACSLSELTRFLQTILQGALSANVVLVRDALRDVTPGLPR
jgi:hypothetical protein